MRFALFFSVVVISFSSCTEGPVQPESIIGRYEYYAFDSTGVPIIRGQLSILTKDSMHISGDWELDTINSPQNTGPQIGNGSFLGWVDHDTTVHIDMNPGWADNNIFLVGKIQDIFIRGTWTWSTLTGETNKGTFEAKKILLAL